MPNSTSSSWAAWRQRIGQTAANLWQQTVHSTSPLRQYLLTQWQRYRAKVLARETTTLQKTYLPAVIELQERPPSPTARWFLWGLLALTIGALFWAIIGRVDMMAIGQGKIIPTSRVKVIQPLESGVVSEIFVTEGQSVNQGEPLVQLDVTLTGADRDRLAQDLEIAQSNHARLTSLLNQVSPSYPVGLAPSLLAEQEALRQETIATHKAEIAALQQQYTQKTHERRATQMAIERFSKTLPLATQRAASYERLAVKGFVAKTQAMNQQEQRYSQAYELAAAQARFAELSATLQALTEQRLATEAGFREKLRTELAEKTQQMEQLTQELTKAEQRNRLQRLVAPISGTVQELRIHTIGGVVTPAQELMKIVPHEDALEAEVKIQNKDIGFVKIGQPVQVKLEAFPFTRYGTIPGRLKKLSLDAIEDEQLGLVYLARVSLDRATLYERRVQLRLLPQLLFFLLSTATLAFVKALRGTPLKLPLTPLMAILMPVGSWIYLVVLGEHVRHLSPL